LIEQFDKTSRKMRSGLKGIVKKGIGEMGFNAGGGAINWFPGHMAAATRAIRDRLKLADLVIEVRDSRVSIRVSFLLFFPR
jgi:hypothetical protein